jgi:hypothetical protein
MVGAEQGVGQGAGIIGVLYEIKSAGTVSAPFHEKVKQ